MRNTLLSLLLVGLSLVASVLLLEYGLRVLYFQPWQERNIVGNPDHRMTPAYHDNVNRDGIRAEHEAEAFTDAGFNVLFLGDSFTYGWRVLQGKTLPAQFEKQAHAAGHTSLHAVNFGWVSSSPLLSGRLLRDIGAKYRPDLVVLTVDMTDIFDDRLYRNILERRYGFRLGHYLPAITQLLSLANQSAWQSEWLARLAFGVPGRHFFIVERPLAETLPYFDELMANVDAIHAYCRDELRVPFVLFVLPRHFQFNPREAPDNWERDQYPLDGPYLLEPFRYFAGVAAQKPYPVIALLDDFRQAGQYPLTFRDDPHLNEQGNAFAAGRMLLHLQQRGLLPE